MYGFKNLCEISKVPFEISNKILNPYPMLQIYLFITCRYCKVYSHDTKSQICKKSLKSRLIETETKSGVKDMK